MFRRTALVALTVAVAAPVALSQSAVGTPPATHSAQVGAWSPITQLDREEIVLTEDAIAIAHNGDVTAAWGCANAERPCWSMLPKGGTWAPREYLGRGHAPAVVVDGAGVVTATWSGPRGVVVARKRPGHAWTSPVVLDRLGWGPDLVVGHSGRVTVAWMQRTEGEKTRIRSAWRRITGGWTPAVNVTKAVNAASPQLGIDRRGVVTLVYAVGSLTREKPGVLTSQRWVLGTGWSTPVTLARKSVSETLATDSAGDVMVAYLRRTFGRLHTVVRVAGQSWESPQVVSPAGVDYLGRFSAAFDTGRTMLVTWARNTGRVDLVRRPLGGSWSAPASSPPRAAGGPRCARAPRATPSWRGRPTGSTAGTAPRAAPGAPGRPSPRRAGGPWRTSLWR
ncbi:MAG: hypothetical protein R2731_13260 [Nocardioides sp.]